MERKPSDVPQRSGNHTRHEAAKGRHIVSARGARVNGRIVLRIAHVCAPAGALGADMALPALPPNPADADGRPVRPAARHIGVWAAIPTAVTSLVSWHGGGR